MSTCAPPLSQDPLSCLPQSRLSNTYDCTALFSSQSPKPSRFTMNCFILFKACKLQLLPNSPLVSGLALSLCPQCTWHDLSVFKALALLSGGLLPESHQLRLSQVQTFIPCGGLPRSTSGQTHPQCHPPASVPSPWQSQAGPRSSVHLQLLQGQS